MPAQEGGRALAEATPPKAANKLAPKPEPSRPPVPETEPETQPYEMDLPSDMPEAASTPDAPAVAHAGKCPACNGKLRAGAVICMNCGFNLAEGGKIKTRIETDPLPAAEPTPGATATAAAPTSLSGIGDERFKRALARTAGEEEEAAERQRRYHFQENILPLILIVAGVLVAVFNGLVLAKPSYNAGLTADELSLGLGVSRGQAAGTYFAGAGKLLLVQIPCLFAGLLVCASLVGSAFGSLGTVLKKLLALTLLGGSFYLSVSMGVNILMYGVGGLGGIFTASVAIALFWGVIVLLFDDLETTEVVILYLAMCVLPFWILTGIQLLTMG